MQLYIYICCAVVYIYMLKYNCNESSGLYLGHKKYSCKLCHLANTGVTKNTGSKYNNQLCRLGHQKKQPKYNCKNLLLLAYGYRKIDAYAKTLMQIVYIHLCHQMPLLEMFNGDLVAGGKMSDSTQVDTSSLTAKCDFVRFTVADIHGIPRGKTVPVRHAGRILRDIYI